MRLCSTCTARRGPPELRENYSFNMRQVTRIKMMLAARLPALCEAWERIHGCA